MNLQQRLSISYYRPIASISEAHHVDLVQHRDTKKVYIRKVMDVYCAAIYEWLYANPVEGIPAVEALCEEDGKLTVVEEYISGFSLEELIENKSLSFEKILSYMQDLCRILMKLHAAQPPIIHRDIKPSNVIITDYQKLMLLDFNAAKQFTGPQSSDTVLIGTQGYAAPEQYGFGSSSPQTDIYACGVLLKEMVSTIHEKRESFEPIIQRCTQMDPSLRYLSAAELLIDLNKLDVNPRKSSKQAPVSYSPVPPGFRSRTLWKMILSSICYLLWAFICCQLTVKDTFGAKLYLERFFCFLIPVATVWCSLNYLGVQRMISLCQSEKRPIRYIGIALLDFLVIMLLFVFMMILEGVFFS